MPTPTPLQFGATLAQPRSGVVSRESVVNLYLEKNPAGAKSPVTLYGTPGLLLLTTVGDGPIRGIQRMAAETYVVSGNELYSVNSSLAATLVGTLEGAGNVHMATNGTHVAIAVDGGKLYAANLSDGVLELPISNVNGIAYLDGYLIYAQEGTEFFYISGIDDATTIDPLDFSAADAAPDAIKGVIVNNREIWIPSEDSVEVWINTGAAGFPMERAGGGFIEHGCRASGSLAKAVNTVFWLGSDLAVYGAKGYQAEPISPPWVERLIAETTDPGSAWAYTYRQLGHDFYMLGFSDLTIGYDITTGLWHRRQSEGIDRWRANAHATFGDSHMVGDYVNGNLYELDLDTYDDNGGIILRKVTAPPIHAQGNRAINHELYIDMEMGVGLPSGQGSDPTLMLEWSDDGGVTWSNIRTASAGVIGAYTQRATWNRLGAFRQRTYQLSISDPVKVAILGAYMRAEGLAT